MKLQYLGTAASEGWPAPFCQCEHCRQARILKGKNIRSRQQALINQDLLLDFGPDTYYHTIRYGINLDLVHTVLLTHSHTDHFYAEELFQRAEPYAFSQDERPLCVYGNERCASMFSEAANGPEAPDRFDHYVHFQTVQAFSPISTDGYEILPLKAVHDPRENCLLYAIRCPDGKSLFYGHDTGAVCEETWDAIKSWHFDLVSLDCTMGATPACASHMGLADDSQVRKKMLALGCADSSTVFVATHFSHGGTPIHETLEKMAAAEGLLAAYDGMTFEI